jgi:hypothetical protein
MAGHDRIPPQDEHLRPPGVDDATVEAVGRVTEALEWVERARGRLYDFHQLVGRADFLLGEAVDGLRAAGHASAAEDIERDLVGRNVLDGRWTFQVVEEFDRCYWAAFRAAEQRVRDDLLDGRPHVYEAELKERRRTHGHPDHRARP